MARIVTVQCCVPGCDDYAWVSHEWQRAKCQAHSRKDEIERAIDLAYEASCDDQAEIIQAYMETMRPYYRARRRRMVIT